ncbi:MAG: CHAD domain-containing protein, partial [Acidimicrobiia bacterium]
AAELSARTGLAGGEEVAHAVDDRAAIEAAIGRFEAALGLVADLEVHDPDVRLRRGLRRTSSRCRRSYRRARRHPPPRRLHRWRIWNKRLWYQVRFLATTAPSVLVPLSELLDRIGETLGDVHDLDVHVPGGRPDPERCAVLERRRDEMVRSAVRWGATIHAERPASFAARLGALWDVAGRDGPEPTP